MIDDLLRLHRPRVRVLAWLFMQRMTPHIEYDDLVQVGMIGLWQALKHDDEALRNGSTFETYSKHRVLGAMIDEMRSRDLLSRDERRKVTRVRRFREKHLNETGATPPLGVIAEALGMTVHEVAEICRTEVTGTTCTLESDEDIAHMAVCYDCPANIAERRERLVWAQGQLDRLSTNQRKVVNAVISGQQLQEVAREIGLSGARASRLLNEVVDLLFAAESQASPKAVNSRASEQRGISVSTLRAQSRTEIEKEFADYFRSWAPTAV